MSQTLLALLCALRCSHLVAVRPQDGLHKDLGNVHHASARAGGLALAVGGSATLQRDGDRKRLHHSDRVALADLPGASAHDAKPGDSVGAQAPSVKRDLHPKDTDPNADKTSHASRDPPASKGVPSTDALTKGSEADNKSGTDAKESAGVPSTDDLTKGSEADNKSGTDEKERAGVPSTDDLTRGPDEKGSAGWQRKRKNVQDEKESAEVDSKSGADEKESAGVPSTDDLTRGSEADNKSGSDEEESTGVPSTNDLTRGPEVDSNSGADKKESADDQKEGQHVDSESSADKKNVAAPVTSPSRESADEKDEVNVAESANAKKEGVQTNSPSDATLAAAQKGLTEAQSGAAPAHENAHHAAAPVALTTNADLSDSIPEKSPIAVLVGDVTVGTMKDNDKDGQATQQLDDIIWDVEELQRIAWNIGKRLGTFYTDESYRHVIVNVVVYLAGVFIALGLYFMCFQHREVSTEQEFRYGLCECFGDVRVSLCGIFCPAIRWADTVSEEKGGFLSFSSALAVMMGLGLLAFRPIIGVFAWIAIVVIGVYYRQRIRAKYGLECDTTPSLIEDFFVWCCCSYCALVQEARQVDDFEGRKNSDYTEESDEFKTGTLRLSETDTGTSW